MNKAMLLLPLACACATVSEADRRDALIHYELGAAAAESTDYIGAMKEFLIALEKDPEQPEAHNAVGTLYMVHYRRPQDAETHFKKAVELKPDFSEAHNNLGTLYLAQNRFSEAVQEFRKALQNPLYRTPYAAQVNLGWALFKSGRKEEGIFEIKAALMTYPKFCQAHRTLGQMYDETGKLEAALESFEKYAKNCPEAQESQWLVADARARLGDKAGAAEALERCRALGTDTELGEQCTKKARELTPPAP